MKKDMLLHHREDEFLGFAAAKEIQKANSILPSTQSIRDVSNSVKVKVIHKKSTHYLCYSLDAGLTVSETQTALKLLAGTAEKLNLKLLAGVF